MSRWGGLPAKLLRKVTLVEGVVGSRLPVHTLTFANPLGEPSLGVRIDHGDTVKVCVPNYKPKSYSMSAERVGEFDITVKIYPNGRASGYLNQVHIGETIDVFRKGSKVRHPGNKVGLVAYGVGITEILPMAVAELRKKDAQSVVLLWASRTYGDTFWHEQLRSLKEEHGERFEYVLILSREEKEGVLHGRITPDVLQKVFVEKWQGGEEEGEEEGGKTTERKVEQDGSEEEMREHSVRFLAIGTKEMMRSTDAMLESIGFPMGKHALLRYP